MKPAGTVLLAIAAVLVTLGVWWLTGVGGKEPAPPSRAIRAEAPGPGRTTEPALETPAAERTSTKEAVPGDRSAAVPVLAEEAESSLRGRTVDSRDRPVPGAEIRAMGRPAADLAFIDREYQEEERETVRTQSGDQGEFEMRLPVGRPHDLRVDAKGFAEAMARWVYAGQDVTVVLLRGASIHGTVRRKQDLAPVAGAEVRVFSSTDVQLWKGTTDGEGRYSVADLYPGDVVLLVIPEQERAESLSLHLEEGEAVPCDVEVSIGSVVTGAVRDKATGLPIEGAEIGAWSFDAKVVRTDASGSYALPGVINAPNVRLCARASGYGRYEILVHPGEGDVVRADFELTRGRTARGRVVSRDGAPVAGAYVAAASQTRSDRWLVRSDWVSKRTASDGRFELTGLRTDQPHLLVVHQERLATTVSKGFDTGAGNTIDLGDIVLPAAASLGGAVVTQDGEPIQGIFVTLDPPGAEGYDFMNRFDHREIQTGVEGSFHFADLAPGKCFLRVKTGDLSIRRELEVDLAEGEARRGVRMELGEGMSIRGRVVDPRDRGVEGASLILVPADPDQNGGVASARSRTDGRFVFSLLEAGNYDITASYHDMHGRSGDDHDLVDGRVAGVAAGASGVLIRLQLAAYVRGTVLSPDGVAVPRALVVAADADGRRVGEEMTDAEGRFRIRMAATATVTLRAWLTRRVPEAEGEDYADETQPPQAIQTGVRGGDVDIVLVVAK
jgi:hypothetical protein